MGANEKRLRITAFPAPATLRLAVLTQDGAGVVRGLNLLADLIAQRTRRLASLLTVYDWEYLAGACEDLCADVLRDGETWGGCVLMAMEDARAARGLHKRVWASDPEGNYDLLVKLAKRWDDLDATAILAAVRFYHYRSRQGSRPQNWWELTHRIRPRNLERPDEGEVAAKLAARKVAKKK